MTAASFLEALISLSLQATVVILMTAWLVRSAKTEQSADRLWASCHLLLLCLATFAFALPHLRLLPHSIINARVDVARVSNLEVGVGTTVFFVWTCGVTVASVSLLIGTFQTLSILQSSESVAVDRLWIPSETITRFPQKPRQRSGTTTSILLLRSSVIKSPFCWQIHRPIIVLPEFLLGFPDDELTSIVKHEIEHLHAGHPLHLFLQRLVEILLWFQPLVWWASYQAAKHREFHCDSSAVSSGHETAAYLRGLLRLAECGVTPAGGLPAGLAFGTEKSLTQQRASRLANRNWERQSATRGDRSLRMFLSASAVLAMLLWAPIDVSASSRSVWSPCPRWSANLLHMIGVPIRDYEIDGHRLRPHIHITRNAKE